MSRYQKKITVAFIICFIALWGSAKSQIGVGLSYGIDPRNEYVDKAIIARVVPFESRIGLILSGYLEREKLTGVLEVNPYYNYARINPTIVSLLDDKPQNTKNYYGVNLSMKAVLGKQLIAPVLGLSSGIIPSYPFRIKNYVKDESFAYELGFSGGLMLFINTRNTVSANYHYGIILPGMGDVYNEEYGFWKVTYAFILTSQLKRNTLKNWHGR